MSKKLHRHTIIGQQGINFIEKITLDMGYLWRPTVMYDVGIDGTIEIRNSLTGAVNNLTIQVQSKATTKNFNSETANDFTFTCKEDDLEYWLGSKTPVIVVISRPNTNEAYWIPVHRYFRDPERRQSRKIIFDKKEDRFDAGSSLDMMTLASKPVTTPLQDLNSLQTRLDELDPFYRLVPHGEKGLIIQGKYPGVEKDHPLKISNTLAFGNTPEGREAAKSLKRLFATGETARIPGAFLKAVRVPDLMLELFDPNKVSYRELIIGSCRVPEVAHINVEIECSDGESAALNGIVLDVVQHGSEEITFANDLQKSPWLLRMVYRPAQETAHCAFEVKESGLPIKQQLKWLRFGQAYAKGGTFRLVQSETGIEIIQQRFGPTPTLAPDPLGVELLEMMLLIQSRTRVPLSLPERDVAAEEIDAVRATVRVLETGKLILTGSDWPIEANLEMAKELLNLYKDGKQVALFYRIGEAAVRIFDVAVPLGSAECECEQTYITEEDRTTLEQFISNPSKAASVPVCIRFAQDNSVHATYTRWLPPTTTGKAS